MCVCVPRMLRSWFRLFHRWIQAKRRENTLVRSLSLQERERESIQTQYIRDRLVAVNHATSSVKSGPEFLATSVREWRALPGAGPGVVGWPANGFARFIYWAPVDLWIDIVGLRARALPRGSVSRASAALFAKGVVAVACLLQWSNIHHQFIEKLGRQCLMSVQYTAVT